MLQGVWKLHTADSETVLYNLSDNPEEDINVAGQYPEVLGKLKRLMDDWNKTLPNRDGAKAVVMPPADIPASTGEISFSR